MPPHTPRLRPSVRIGMRIGILIGFPPASRLIQEAAASARTQIALDAIAIQIFVATPTDACVFPSRFVVCDALSAGTIEEEQRKQSFRTAMTITLDPKLEARLRQRADAEGLTVSTYIERLVNADQAAEEELESIALEGFNSGEAIEVGPEYWHDKHRRLDERLKRTGTR